MPGGPRLRDVDVWNSHWWPKDHSVTGEAGLEVVLEGRLGGRIFERTEDGTEHEWGEITRWEPPTRLVYLWHLNRDRSDATEVEIHFQPDGSSTRIEIEHRGWEKFGASADELRERNRFGWRSVIPHFTKAITEGATQ